MSKNIYKKAIRFSCVSLIALGSINCAIAGGLPVTESVKSSGKLTISNALGYPPLQFADAGGKPSGLNIELAEATAKVLNAKLDLIIMPFPSQIPTLSSGRTKIAWAAFSVTGERLKQVDFITYLSAPTVLVTTSENSSRFKGAANLCGAVVAVAAGSAADFAADKLSASCTDSGKEALKKKIYPDEQSTIQAVQTGKVDGLLDDATVASYLESKTNKQFVIAPGAYFPVPLGVAVSKGDTETAQMIQAAFQELMKDGTYQTIIKKYNMQSAAIDKSEIITNVDQIPKN